MITPRLVKVTDLLKGYPSSLLVTETTRGPAGKPRLFTQKIQVPDADLWAHLTGEVKKAIWSSSRSRPCGPMKAAITLSSSVSQARKRIRSLLRPQVYLKLSGVPVENQWRKPVKEWDTWGLFRTLLDEFPRFLRQAEILHSDNPEDTFEVRVAIEGFQHFMPLEEWRHEHYRFIRRHLDGDLSHLEWFEECAEAVRLFSCLCLGAMLGKHASAEIDDAGILLGEAHLAGFNTMQDSEICESWNRYRRA